MADTWLSIRVELIEGGGNILWPRPGRVFAAARSHTFADLATAIDVAFARWDHAHLHMFDLGNLGGILVDPYWEDLPDGAQLDGSVKLGVLSPGQQFVYVFDLGDNWAHLCTVGAQTIDPLETVGLIPAQPTPYWGWGAIPDQYGRRWEDDDGARFMAADPGLIDLPPLQPRLGPTTERVTTAARRPALLDV